MRFFYVGRRREGMFRLMFFHQLKTFKTLGVCVTL